MATIGRQRAPGNCGLIFWKYFLAHLRCTINYIIHPSLVYREFFSRPEKFKEMPDRTGEVVVLTGGTGGIGLDVFKKLMQARFHVILGCLSIAESEAIIATISASEITTGSYKLLELNLKSFKSVVRFANDVLREAPRIDLLINNAGIMWGPYEVTEDGYESHFQVNYLSHFLLTNLLIQRMKETSKRSDKTIAVRIVSTASVAHFGGALDFEDLENCKVYAFTKSYADSKLCQVMHAKYLDKILQDENLKVNAYSLHPGIISSGLWSNIPCQTCVFCCFKGLYKTTEDGADTVIYTALSPELEGVNGVYIDCCEICQASSRAMDVVVQEKLWNRSLQLVSSHYGVSPLTAPSNDCVIMVNE